VAVCFAGSQNLVVQSDDVVELPEGDVGGGGDDGSAEGPVLQQQGWRGVSAGGLGDACVYGVHFRAGMRRTCAHGGGSERENVGLRGHGLGDAYVYGVHFRADMARTESFLRRGRERGRARAGAGGRGRERGRARAGAGGRGRARARARALVRAVAAQAADDVVGGAHARVGVREARLGERVDDDKERDGDGGGAAAAA
jgi:hypothetical protein